MSARLPALPWVLSLLLPGLLVAPARAQEPTIHQEGGATVGTLDLPVSVESVRAVLSDPAQAARLTPDVLSVEITPEGRCQGVGLTTRGVTHPLAIQALRCPIADGWRQDLVQSDDFTSYQVTWQVYPSETGSHVVFRLVMGLNLSAPAFLVKKGVEANVLGTLSALKKKLLP